MPCISTHEKILIIFFTYFGDPLSEKLIFFSARGVQLDNGVDPPWLDLPPRGDF